MILPHLERTEKVPLADPEILGVPAVLVEIAVLHPVVATAGCIIQRTCTQRLESIGPRGPSKINE